MKIFHIVPAQTWREALEFGIYRADSLETEGFIHCCTEEQVPAVRDVWFAGVTDLLLVEIDPQLLTVDLKYEDSHHNGELFPHLYGPLNLDAVSRVTVCQ